MERNCIHMVPIQKEKESSEIISEKERRDTTRRLVMVVVD